MIRSVETSPLAFRAEIGTVNQDERTVDLIFSTGADADRYDYSTGRPYVERLSLDPKHIRLERLNAGASLLDTHSAYSLASVIGAVVPGSAKIERAARGICRAIFSRRDAVRDVIVDVQDGILRFVSIGYKVRAYRQDGNDARGWPILTAIDWEPYEVSIVPMPVDLGAQTRAEDAAVRYAIPVVADEGGHLLSERSMDPVNPNPGTPPAPAPAPVPVPPADAVRAIPPATPPAPVAAPVIAAPPVAATVEQVRAIGAAVRLPAERILEIAARGLTIDQVRAEVLNALATTSDATAPRSGIVIGADARDKFARGVGDWLLIKAGAAPLLRAAKVPGADALDPGEFRGLSLVEIARMALEHQGVQTRGLDKLSLIGRAFTTRDTFTRDASITQSTSDFPTLLENVMHKIMQAAYSTVEDSWSKFCKRGSVSDFRAHNRYRMGMFGALDALGANGEFLNKAINDAEKATITAATKGNIINVSRAMVVNDDLGAFTSLLSMLGRAAALSIEVDVFALLALNSGLGPTQSDSQPLFHANRANVTTGAAFSTTAIDLDRQAMASQRDPWGNEFLSLRPSVLLVPLSLGGQARITNQAQYDVDASNKFQVPNKVAGLFREVVDTPRLSGTRRYLFADPSVAPVIEVAFLEGYEAPVLESRDGWRQDGTEMRARFDYGVAAVDYRGAVTNAGA